MNALRLFFAWGVAHPQIAGALLLASPAFVRALFRTVFAPVFKIWPRSRAFVDGVIAMIPAMDLWRATLKMVEALTGQHLDPYPDPRDEEIARRGSQIATLQQEVVRLQAATPPRVRSATIEAAPPAEITEGAKPAGTSIHDSDGSNGEH